MSNRNHPGITCCLCGFTGHGRGGDSTVGFILDRMVRLGMICADIAATCKDGTVRIIDRRLTGTELLRLQGFGDDLSPSRSVPSGFTTAQLTDLAGNAFCSGVCIATLLATLIAVPHREAIELSNARRSAAPAAEVAAVAVPDCDEVASNDGSDSDFALS